MTGTYETPLVWLSLVIAVLSSYTALDMAGRMRESTGRMRSVWLVGAACAMGGGIWSMHFVAMLAYHMPGMSFGHDTKLTLASLAIAVAATGIGFAVVSRTRSSLPVLLGAGLFTGLGIVCMHYLGMAAMEMPATARYDRTWVVVSVAIAVVAATAALWIAFRHSSQPARIGAALVMGLAVSGMHYAAMRGVTFVMDRGANARGIYHLDQNALAVGVAIASFIILFCALSASVFDRRLAEVSEREARSLRLSEERFRELYRGTPLPLHSLDREGRIDQVSDTWLDLTGYRREEVIGRQLQAFMTEESAREMTERAMPQLARDGTICDVECRMATKSGSILDVLLSATINRDPEGRFVSVMGGLTDVTQRRRAEEALRQSQKIEAIGQLTGGVAHDFNNMLAIVIGNLDLVSRKVKDQPRTLRLVENALEGANRGASLTQRLLAFARRQDLSPAAVDVRDLLDGMREMLQRTLGPMIDVQTVFPDDLPRARVDAHQLEMAIVNLAVNARDAMPQGGSLTIAARASMVPTTKAQDMPPGYYVCLEVRDTGIGMDEATMARASEPFFTTKQVGHGTGLGLSMVQGLAAQSGGHLTMKSTPGSGTSIMIWLPVADAVEEADTQTATPAHEDMDALGILVVDDDPLVLDNTAAMLEDLGHRVTTATSGQQALDRLADTDGIDLLVTDQLMPGMTGTQLVRRVATVRPRLRVMLVSGYSDLAEVSKMGLVLLPKPFDQRRLSAALRDARPCRAAA